MYTRLWRWCLVAIITMTAAFGAAAISADEQAGAATMPGPLVGPVASAGDPAGPAPSAPSAVGAASSSGCSACAPTLSAVIPAPVVRDAPAAASPALVPPTHLSIAAIALETDVAALGWSLEETGEGLASVWNELPRDRAAWLSSSAMPGANSNVVITGHHNVGAEVFRDLEKLAEDDELVLTAGSRTFRYSVSERFLLLEGDVPDAQRQWNAAWIQPSTCERLTLVTCWPYETNTHRLVIVADPLPAPAPHS